MATYLFGNLSSRTASYTIEPGNVTLPTIVQGDTFTLAVRLTETNNNVTTVTAPSIYSARLSYGPVDVAPTAGSFKVLVNSITSSVITFGSTAASVAAVLNGMSAATGWAVIEDQGSYIVSRTSNWVATSGITIVQNELIPQSFVRVTSYSANSNFYQELRPMQSPLAYTSAFGLIVPPPPSITRVVTGYSDEITGTYINEVQRLYIPPSFGTTFQIYRGTSRTALLNKDDGSAEIQGALMASCVTKNAGESFLVSNPEDYVANIEFAGTMSGATHDLLTVSVPVSPQGDVTFNLDFNTQGMLAALRGDYEVTHPLTCELGINYGTVATPNIQYITVFQQDMTVQADGAWTGLAAAQSINWLNPPQPVNYIPFTLDQVITGIQSYTKVVTGSGPWTIAHNLGTEAIHVTVRENFSNGYFAINGSDYVIRTSTSQSVIVESQIGSTVSQGWAVMISSAGPTSVFQAHTHTVAQVVSLQDYLNSLTDRMTAIEDILPAVGAVGLSTVTLPYVIPVKEKSEVLFTSADFSTDSGIGTISSSIAAPYLLRALSVTVGTAPSSAVITATTVNIVSAYTSGLDIEIPRIGIIPGRKLPSGIAYVGAEATRALVYEVNRYQTNKTYYPAPYERTIFEVAVNDKMFRANQTLSFNFDIAAQTKDATASVQWWVMVDVGEVTTASTPVTQSSNITGITYNSYPILAQPIVVVSQLQRHQFGIEIIATATTNSVVMSANQIAYGLASSAVSAAPSGRNFVLRGRLANFDVADNFSDPRGFVGYAIVKHGTDPLAINIS
jgi:hypothetical protein